jgi:Domain of unknown function (DUF1772)
VTRQAVLFGTLLFAALITGGQYVVWWDYDPAGAAPVFFVEKMQHAIRAIAAPLFTVQCAAAVLTIASAWLARQDRAAFRLLLAVCACYVIAVLLTIFGAIPILNQIATWNIDAPPSDWHEIILRWWWIHSVRFVMQLTGLSLLIAVALRGFDHGRAAPSSQSDNGKSHQPVSVRSNANQDI